MPASAVLMLPVTQAATVTAGLTCPPERYPITDTITARTRPWAMATPISPLPPRGGLDATMTDPAPTNTRAKVATNSATAFCPAFSKFLSFPNPQLPASGGPLRPGGMQQSDLLASLAGLPPWTPSSSRSPRISGPTEAPEYNAGRESIAHFGRPVGHPDDAAGSGGGGTTKTGQA